MSCSRIHPHSKPSRTANGSRYHRLDASLFDVQLFMHHTPKVIVIGNYPDRNHILIDDDTHHIFSRHYLHHIQSDAQNPTRFVKNIFAN